MADATGRRANGRTSLSLLAGATRAVRSRFGALVVDNGLNVGAVGAACLLLAAPGVALRVVAVLMAVATFAVLVWQQRRGVGGAAGAALLGQRPSVRAFLFVAVGAFYVLRRPDDAGWVWAAVAVAALLALSEDTTRLMLAGTRQVVANLPGVQPVPQPLFPPRWLTTLCLATLALGGLLAAIGAPGWLFLAVALVGVPPAATTAWHAVQAVVMSRRAEAAIPDALRRYQPAFAVYYAARIGARYQLGMWLPYLARLNKPFIVITREVETVETIEALTDAPILVPKVDNVSASLDAMVVPSLKAAFYVQGSPANQTFQRNRRLTHVWLNHGDSDKQANFHPRHASFDKLFVSGQLAIDRYAAHGIDVLPEKFVLVGRPQIEAIEYRDQPLGPGAPRTILYAPTWRGGRPSTNYSSLPVGAEIVNALLERGSTVLFRPHPTSYSNAEDAVRIRAIHDLLEADRSSSARGAQRREHVFGAAAETAWDVPACFNASDGLVTDVSSMASEYLASGKPFAMVAVTAGGEAFRHEFPTARVAYVIEKDLSTLTEALDQLYGDDPLAAERLSYRRYCLGETVGPRASEAFLRAAGEIIASGARPGESAAPRAS